MTPPNLKLVMVGVLLFLCQQFSGVNAINFYSTKIFKESKIGFSENVLTAIWGSFDLTALILGLFFLVDKFPRRKIYLSGILIIFFLLSGCSILSGTSHTHLIILMLFSFILTYSFSLGPMTWIIMTETTPGSLVSIPVAAHWVCNLVIAQLFPVLVDAESVGLGMTFGGFAVITFFNMIFFYALVKETIGKSGLEIREMYLGKRNREEIVEVRRERINY